MSPIIRRVVKWVALGVGVVLVAVQFVPVERSNPPVVADLDAPDDVETILRRSCYDCHSHETRWPWYSHVAPVSWYVIEHVEHARGDLNFSRWPAFDYREQEEIFEDIREEVSEGEMPLKSYVLLHPSARLSPEERERLIRWTREP